MRARDVMSENVLTVQAGATVLEAARLLVNAGVSAMPVVDERGAMIGILSGADLIRNTGALTPTDLTDIKQAARVMEEARSRKVAEIMTRTVVTAAEDTLLHEIAGLLLKHGIKRVPIVRGGAVVGVVSRVDLLQALISVGLDAYTQTAPASESEDEALRVAVLSVLARQGWSHVQRADVVISGGTIHLWGTVPDNDTRARYVQSVRTVPGVRAVENHMHVGRRLRPGRHHT